jgi:hypothetical protein
MPLLAAYMARNAVVAGSAARVHRGVSRRQSGRWAQQDPMRQWQAWYGASPSKPKPR